MAGHPIFARIYDRLMAGCEDGGLSDKRHALLAGAEGATLELGAGTGHNLDHYTPAVSRLVLTEPDPHMAKRLRTRVEDTGSPPIEVVEADAESLPFPDDTFDTVVATLVLCTVADPDAALAEVARVLKPGGRMLFLEHVRADTGRRGRWQDRLNPIQKAFFGGCNLNRRTADAIRSSPLEVQELRDDEMPKEGGPLVRPMIVGSARVAA